MKIALISEYTYPDVAGGTEVRTSQLAQGLRKKGHEVFEYPVKTKGVKKTRYVDPIDVGVKMFSGRRSTLATLKYSIALYQMLRKQKFDVIDCCAFPYLPALACLMASGKAKTVLTWHTYFGTWWISYRGPIMGCLGMVFEKICKILSKNNIAVSETVSANLKNAQVIEPAVDVKEIEKARPLKPETEAVTVCRLIEGKGLFRQVDAVAAAPGARLKIIGSGPLRKNLLKYVVEKGLEDRILLLGEMTQEGVYGHLKSARVYLQTSQVEGYGLSQAQAAAAGAVVLALRADKAHSLAADNAHVGWGDYGKTLARLLEDEGFYKTCRKAQLDMFRPETVEEFIDKTLKYYIH